MKKTGLTILAVLFLVGCTEVQPPEPDPRLDQVIERLDVLDAKLDILAQQIADDPPALPTDISLGKEALRECVVERMFAPTVAAALSKSGAGPFVDIEEMWKPLERDGLGELEAIVTMGAIFGCWGE